MPEAVKRGRPPTPADQRCPRLLIRTRPEYLDLLDTVARQNGESRTQIIERAIRTLLERYANPPRPS